MPKPEGEEPASSLNDRFGDGAAGLRQRVARGTVINAAFSVGLSAVGLLKGFAAAAFISRTDYGVWGVLFISLGTLVWLKQVGIGDKYIQQDEERPGARVPKGVHA